MLEGLQSWARNDRRQEPGGTTVAARALRVGGKARKRVYWLKNWAILKMMLHRDFDCQRGRSKHGLGTEQRMATVSSVKKTGIAR